MVDTARRPSQAKIRLLTVADTLFYADGIVTVGIDRIIAEAEVTKATFYKQYGSKDTLILEYIVGRDTALRSAYEGVLAAAADPRTGFEDLCAAIVADTAAATFRGDAFLNAAAEFSDPAHPVRAAVLAHREWLTEFAEEMMRAAAHPKPGAAADEFLLLKDGVLAGAYAGDAIAAATAFTRATKRLLDELDA